MNGKVTYRQQFTRCGKQRCHKCREGPGHGPYWYAYWSEKGRTVSKYIGSNLPEDIAAKQHATREDKLLANIDTALQQTAAPTLRIYLLGQFRLERKVEGEWTAVDSRTWHRRRARALLGCLLNSPARRLGREQVMDLLWPDLDIDIAANRLNGAVHELRQILEPDILKPASSRMLRLERDVLELADSTQIWVDAEEFENLLKDADTTSDTNTIKTRLEAAANLYQGSYLLEELYSEWATQRRDALQRAWAGLLLKLAQILVEREEFVNAIETLDRLRSTDPSNETALQRLMILLTQLDRRGEALQVYRQHVSMLQRDYESDPLPETIELYEKLRQGHIPSLSNTKAAGNTTRVQTKPVTECVQKPQATLHDAFIRPLFQLGRHNQSPLIGRERELQTLYQIMHAIEGNTATPQREVREDATKIHDLPTPSSGHTHFLLLKGEPGIGKTRLAEELSLAAYSTGWTVAWSRSYEQESSIPYHPWTELLRTLFQSSSTFTDLANSAISTSESTSAIPGSSALKLERLGALLPDLHLPSHATTTKTTSSVSHEQERLYLWEAALGLIGACSKSHPLLLVLDDLHWADDSSIELLTHLVHHLHNQRVLVVGTCRDGEIAPQHRLRSLVADLQREQTIAIVSVQPLTQSQIGNMVSHLPEDIVQSIQTQAAGNPFFAEELARHVHDDHDLFEVVALDEPRQHTTYSPLYTKNTRKTRIDRINGVARDLTQSEGLLPEAIAAVLERRLNRLSNDCQSLLGKAAVLGGSFELSQLQTMAGEQNEDNILDLLEEALHAGLLTEEGTGAHITYHFWHPLIISHLYGRLSAARRAQLHRKAAEVVKAAYLEKAAATIVYHLHKGGGNLTQIAHYAEIAGHQAYMLAAYAEAQQYYFQVLQALAHNAWETPTSTDTHNQLQHLLTKDIAQFSFTNPLSASRTLERIAECSIIVGNFEDGRRLYENALRLRQSGHFQRFIYSATITSEQPQREAQIQALLWREIGNTWSATGEYEQAYDCYEKGKAVMVQAGITSGPAWAGLQIQYGAMLRLDGHYHKARRYLQEALAILEEAVQQPVSALPAPAPSSGTASLIENNDQSEPSPTRIERALNGDPLEIGYAHERLGIVAASLGENHTALEHLHTALAIYEPSELVSIMARICGNLGAVSIIMGAHDTAWKYLRRALDLAERGGDLPNMTFVTHNLGEVAQRTGKLHEAEQWFQRSLALAERITDRECMSSSCVALASVQVDLGNCRDAAANIKRAINSARIIKSPRCIRYTLVGLADLRIAQATEEIQLPISIEQEGFPSQTQHYLFRAQSLLQRAIALEGLEVENIIEGKHLLALVYFWLDDLESAFCTAQQALQDAQRHETSRIIGRALELLGRILARQGKQQEADSHFQHAIQHCREHGLRIDYARALYHYGDLLLQHHLLPNNVSYFKHPSTLSLQQQALNYLYEARTIFTDCQAANDLKLVENTIKLRLPQ
jgi:predicted ATPase/DNA-binding SARP family transcriptional activator